MMEQQVFMELVRRLEASLSEMKSDIRDMKDAFVSYKDHVRVVDDVNELKDRVTEIERSSDKNAWLVKAGDKFLYAVLGGVLAAVMKLVGVL